MALPPLSVKIGAETDGLTKGLTGAQASIARFAKVGVAAAGAVGVAMIALTKQSMAQVDAQAKLAQSMGTTVRSMQTLEQAGKLAGVAMSGVQQATGDLTRRLAQAASGTGPVADALDRLGLSAVALSNIPLDERVLKINEALNAMVPAAERAAVAGQLFGEEGSLAMARIDTATIRQARVDIERFGVSVSEVGANQIEAANDAVTRLGMVFTGIGNQLAVAVAPALEATANIIAEFAGRVIGAKTSLEEFFGTLERARQQLGDKAFNRLIGNPSEILAQTQAIDAVAQASEGLVMSSIKAVGEFASLRAQFQRLGTDEGKSAAAIMDSLGISTRSAIDEFNAGVITSEEFADRMMSIEDEARATIAALDELNNVEFSSVMSSLTALRGVVNSVFKAAVDMQGALPGGVSMQAGPTSRRGTRAGTSGLAPSTSLRPQLPGVDFGEDHDAGGGAGTDPNEALREQMATRLQTLMEGLMTERETVAQWYAEGQALIDSATDAELAAIGGKQAAIERLAEEHQARLSRIRELGAAADLHTVLGAGAEILNAMGQTNEKALKVAKVFGAAQALIGAYQGAAEALKLPFPKNIAAAATVLAKGISFVSAIKGVNKGGGAVASTGGATAAATAPEAQAAPQASQTLNFSVTNDPFGISDRLVRQIVGAINQSQRDGSTLIRATVS